MDTKNGQIAHRRMIAGPGILRNHGQNNNSPAIRQIKGRPRLSEAEKATLAEIAHRLGREALENVAATANSDTILGWYRKFIRTSLTDRNFADEQVDRGLMKKSNVWSCKW